MMRNKLKEVVAAVYQLHKKTGVNLGEVEDFLQYNHGRMAMPDFRRALKVAVDEGFVALKNGRLFPTALANMPLYDARRRRSRRRRRGRRHEGDLELVDARRRRRSGRRRRRGRRHELEDVDDLLEARRRRRRGRRQSDRSRRRRSRRGRRHELSDDDEFLEARRRRRRGGMSGGRPRRRRGRRHVGAEQEVSSQGQECLQTDVPPAQEEDVKPELAQ